MEEIEEIITIAVNDENKLQIFMNNFQPNLQLLGAFLNVSKNEQINSEKLSKILQYFYGIKIYNITCLDETDITIAIVSLFDDNIVSYTMKTLSISSYSIFDRIIQNKINIMINVIWQKIGNDLPQFSIIELIDKAKDQELEYIYNFMINILRVNTMVEYPSWVISDEVDCEEEENIHTEQEILNFTKEFTEKFKFTKKDSDIDTDVEQIISLAVLLCSDNNKLNKLYGPKNSKLENCKSGGPCRMLKCKCNDDEFKGYCDGCLKGIRNISHSIRYPCSEGGFLGYYCNMNCMVKNLPIPADEYTDLRLDNVQMTIEKFGILDKNKNK